MIRRRARGRSPEPEPTNTPIWRRIDLHLHTPGSIDYQEPDATYLDILRQAEARGLDIIAFTDHNSVAGYAALREEVARLEFLEERQRLLPDEAARLAEYRRLAARLLILPGFEFTATFGFHILGIFPETTTVRKLEHLLLALNVPEEKLAHGSSEVGATADVLSAYEVIAEAGGLVIGAHVNSTHGVAMVGLGLGGQTKIAYTQDENLHALEVTDLDSSNRRSTARFFNGAKSEYPRQMHCIQGSDAHRIERDPRRPDKNLGVGDRCTEVLLPEVSFAALKELFMSDEFTRVRPYQPSADPFHALLAARQDGDSLTHTFHEAPGVSGAALDALLRDIAGFANTNGGVLYLGASANPTEQIRGVERPTELAEQVQALAARLIVPPLALQFETLTGEGKAVLAVTAPRGRDRPYAVEPGFIYVRRGAATALAPRDEIVRLVQATLSGDHALPASQEPDPDGSIAAALPSPSFAPRASAGSPGRSATEPLPATPARVANHERLPIPRTGVEIVSSGERNNTPTHTVRDLRNRRVIRNVTRASATRLWRYAVTQREDATLDLDAVQWDERDPRLGYISGFVQPEGIRRYNLVFHDRAEDNGAEPTLRVFYGVTEEGIDDRWKALLPPAEALPVIDFDRLPAGPSDERADREWTATTQPEGASGAPAPPGAGATPPSGVGLGYSIARAFSDPPRSELAAHAPEAIAPSPSPPAYPVPATPASPRPGTSESSDSAETGPDRASQLDRPEPEVAEGAKPRRRRAPRKPRPATAPTEAENEQAAGVAPGDLTAPTATASNTVPPPASPPAGEGGADVATLGASAPDTGGATSADLTDPAPKPARRRRPARRREATTAPDATGMSAAESGSPALAGPTGEARRPRATGGEDVPSGD